MNANDIAPNLYEEWGLDRRDGERELLVLLESKDLLLEQQGQDIEDPRRAQLRIAAGVLGSAAKRAEYDKACGAGLRPTWGDLGQLGAVGQWSPQPQQAQQHAQSFQPGRRQDRGTMRTKNHGLRRLLVPMGRHIRAIPLPRSTIHSRRQRRTWPSPHRCYNTQRLKLASAPVKMRASAWPFWTYSFSYSCLLYTSPSPRD